MKTLTDDEKQKTLCTLRFFDPAEKLTKDEFKKQLAAKRKRRKLAKKRIEERKKENNN